MAKNEKQLKATKTRSAVKLKTRKKTEANQQKKARRSAADTRQQTGQDLSAADKFRTSASEQVASGATEIAKGLRTKAAQGNIGCAKFLWDLVNTKSQPLASELDARFSQVITDLESDLKARRPAAGNSPSTQNSTE